MSTVQALCNDTPQFGRKIALDEYIRDPQVIAAFDDMVVRGSATLMLRDDGALLMLIRGRGTEEVLFKVTRTGLHCLARWTT